MNSPEEMDAQIKAAQKVCLEAWCKKEGIEYISHRYSELFDTYSIGYLQEGIEASYHFKFDHPFMFELIKGLDEDQKLKYYKNLADIIAQTFGSVPGIWLLKTIQLKDITIALWEDMHTTEVDNLVLAYAALEG